MLFFQHESFLYSLLSIGILVLFHLIKRKNIKEVEFSTIMFILKSHKRISKKLKIKEFILFLLRLIIIISLILVITRVSLKKESNNIQINNKNNKLIVLDNNYQMLLKNGKSDDFTKAKELIKTFFLNNSKSNSIFFKGKEYSISSISQLNRILNKIKISYNYNNSTIHSFFKIKYKFKNQDVIIVSNYKDLLNNDLNYSLITHKSIDNQYIKKLKIKRVENNRYQIKLIIDSASTQKETKTITLYQKNKKISQSIITINPNEIKEVMINFTIKGNKNKKELEYKISLESDDLNYDNNKFFIINMAKPKEVLIVNGSPSNISYKDESFYIKSALNSSNMRYHFNLTQRTWVTSRIIKKFDLILFLNNTFDDYENKDFINKFLKNGKSIFISLGGNTNIENFNYFWKGILSLRNFKNLEKNKKYKFLNLFNYNNSFLKKSIFVKEHLASFPILKYFNLTTKQNLKVLASLNDGTPLIAEKILKKGKLIIYTSSIDRDWNNLPLSTNYPPLMISIINYLLDTNNDIYNFYTMNINKLNNFKNKNLKSGIYTYYKKIAYNTPLKRSKILNKKNKSVVKLISSNNLLIPLKNYFIMIIMFIIFLETLFFIKRYLWVKNG